MASLSPDRFTVPSAFWRAIAQLGIDPGTLLRAANLPASLLAARGVVTTAQYFELWQALAARAGNAGLGLGHIARLDPAVLPASAPIGYYARDFRDALLRTARYRQLYTPQNLQLAERDAECTVTVAWPYTHGAEPLLLTDVIFAGLLELGRRGSGRHIVPLRVELRHADPGGQHHARYYGSPVLFDAPHNALVLHRDDLDLPFPGHNPEVLALLTPVPPRELGEHTRQLAIGEQVKFVLKRSLYRGRPDIREVAHALCTSERTLQRRITATGTTFRALLGEARRELACQLLQEPVTSIPEVARLLGFEDSNSFYRAFRGWEGTTPVQWRQQLEGKGG